MFELIRDSHLSFEVITEYMFELIRNSPDSFGGIAQLIRSFEANTNKHSLFHFVVTLFILQAYTYDKILLKNSIALSKLQS